MEILIKILQFILSLSLLVIIHELGHFIFAKIFRMRVEKFYLFFNPWFSIFKFRIGETTYGMGWVPFGGYCKISGMVDESMDTGAMKLPPKPYEFRSKPAWQRLLVMLGGVMMNVLLAFCIYCGMSYAWGDQYLDNKDMKWGYTFNAMAREIGFENGDKILAVDDRPVDDISRIFIDIVINQSQKVSVERDGRTLDIIIPESYVPRMLNGDEGVGFLTPRTPFVIEMVADSSGAARGGLLAGDRLTSFNGEPMEFFDQFQGAFTAHKGETVELGIVRDSAGVKTERTLYVEISPEGRAGVIATPIWKLVPVQTKKYTLLESIPAGLRRTGQELGSYWKQLKLVFNPKTEAYKSIGGVISIGNIFPSFWSWEIFWRLTALLSVILAVMNLLPIPGLDGGHALLLLAEIVTGRKPSLRFMEITQIIGMTIIFLLFIYATSNDIHRIFLR